MGRKKKSESATQPLSERIIVATFADGPKAGDRIQIANPPAKYMKVAYPEWAVYEWSGEEYRVILKGELALKWRNPVRPTFFSGHLPARPGDTPPQPR